MLYPLRKGVEVWNPCGAPIFLSEMNGSGSPCPAHHSVGIFCEPNCFMTLDTRMVFAKSRKFKNSGSESKGKWAALAKVVFPTGSHELRYKFHSAQRGNVIKRGVNRS